MQYLIVELGILLVVQHSCISLFSEQRTSWMTINALQKIFCSASVKRQIKNDYKDCVGCFFGNLNVPLTAGLHLHQNP